MGLVEQLHRLNPDQPPNSLLGLLTSVSQPVPPWIVNCQDLFQTSQLIQILVGQWLMLLFVFGMSQAKLFDGHQYWFELAHS